MDNRKLLLIAYHYPPIQGSTGTTRTVAFSRYLASFGWDVCILTIAPTAYEALSTENESLVPPHVTVERAWGFDARRKLSIRGRYFRTLAIPDRWQSWIAGGYFRGCHVVKSWKPDAIMSTYPIASAHVIGLLLQGRFSLPWVAEFRDPMLQDRYPVNYLERNVFRRVERRVFKNASKIVVTTSGCRNLYVNRYPNCKDQVIVISNGYDPNAFERIAALTKVKDSSRLVLLHSGLLYPHERDPTAFFEAVRSLRDTGCLEDWDVEFRFRASGHDEQYRQTTIELGIAPWVRFLPGVPYLKALNEMTNVDALMVFQAQSCNDQIPAKIYEYLHCRKPIIAFTDPEGDTGGLLASLGTKHIARLDNSEGIQQALEHFLRELTNGSAYITPQQETARFSRKALTGELGDVLTRAVEMNGNQKS